MSTDEMALDRLTTEQVNPRTKELDRLTTVGILERINDEDALVATAVRRAISDIALAVDAAAKAWREGGRIILFGAGTSGRLATLDAAEVPPTFGIAPDRYQARIAGGPGALVEGVEGAEDDRAAGVAAAADLSPRDLAFGIAASGRTPFVLGALEEAGRRGARTVGFACAPAPALASWVDILVVVDTGPEAVTGSTRMKAGTAQKMVLTAFSTALMVRLGKVYGNLMVDLRVTNEKLQRRAVRLIADAAGVDVPLAEQAIREAHGEVKAAIAVLRLGVTRETALALLEASDGSLREVLDEGPGKPGRSGRLPAPGGGMAMSERSGSSVDEG